MANTGKKEKEKEEKRKSKIGRNCKTMILL